MSYLPELNGLSKAKKAGRIPYEGSQRGWGLQYGDLRQHVLADTIYRECLKPAHNWTILAEDNRMNLFLIIKYFINNLSGGHIVEFGSYKGGNAIFLALLAKKLFPGMRVYALDTYEGMPATDKSIDMHNQGDFRETNYEKLMNYKSELGLDNLIPVKGLFEDTWDSVREDGKSFVLAHIDCDIAPAVKFSYEAVKENMVSGGYIIFDDALTSSCLGATEIVEDFCVKRDNLNCEQAWPHFVFRYKPII